MKLEEVFNIVRRKRFAVVSTAHDSGAPESALVGFALTHENEIVFDTLSTTRKAANLARRPAASLVIGWDDDISIQIEGDARQPVDDDLARVKAAYFHAWPDGRERENWPEIAYFVVRPRWVRYSCYAGAPVVEEFTM
jgi:pyridoxine/pyridoxamine 5'-phosphate oxidase